MSPRNHLPSFFKPLHAAVEAGPALPLDGGVKCQQRGKGEEEEVKYIGYWEYDSKDEKEVIAAYMRMLEQVAEEPEKWAKMIGDPMVTGGCGKGYTIYEADEPDQLGRVCVWMGPWLHFNFVPLFDVPAQMALVEERDKFLARARRNRLV